MKQVDKDAYTFARYAHPGRFVSYYHQLKEVIQLSPRNVLEVGVGDGVFRDYIKNNTDIEYKSVDVANDLNPDVVGSVTSLPFEDDSFDVVCAFEVLEHIQFEEFERALTELARVSRGAIILSLPHFGPPLQFYLKLPLLKPIRVSLKMSFPKIHVFNGQHYWEIGKRGYSSRVINHVLSKYFVIKNDFVPFENQYHHFYLLEKIND